MDSARQTIWAMIRVSGLALLVGLSACGGHLYHVVQRGETLYSIGWSYGYDYREIARWNDIDAPYQLAAGQRLRVAPPARGSVAAVSDRSESRSSKRPPGQGTGNGNRPPPVVVVGQSAQKPTVEQRNQQLQESGLAITSTADPDWQWPTRSHQVLSTYSRSDPARQGLDLSGSRGTPVYAAADGYVVYAGSGLVRYGRLIIIKHNEKYLSAYAHNHSLKVKEGQVVKAGQHIADMGSTGTNQPKLHFEIRQNGKPVNPLQYLPR